MTDKSKALENFSKAHASDGPAKTAKETPATKAEQNVSDNTSRAPEQPTEREVKHRSSAADGDHELHWAYQQGRIARLNGISKEDAPHDSESDEYKAWLKGWKFEDNA